jgi:hypothetical protein
MKACRGVWNWRCVVGGLLVAGLLLPGGICRGGTVCDAAADLTKESIAANANPNGPWSYGYRASAASSEFTPLPSSGVEEIWRTVGGDVQGWWLEPARGVDHTPPWVLKNMGTAIVSSTFHPFSSGTLTPGAMCVHPADGARAYVVVRWTAPAPGSYSIDAVFTGLDSYGATTDVHVVINGRDLFAGDIRGGLKAPTNVATYSKTISVATGDTIDFAVGPGSNGYVCDCMGLAAKITLVAPASGGTVYDAAADLTEKSIAAHANPNGPWSYGCRAAAVSNDLTLFPLSGVSQSWRRVTENVQGWWLAPTTDPWSAPTPTVLKNVGPEPVASTFHPFSQQTLAAGAMYVHPDNGANAYAVVRWTAPAPGSYLIDTVFTGKDSRGATTDVHVVVNGRELFAGDIRGGMDAPTNTASYAKTVSVAAGDKIDFAVGPGGNGNICDSTGLAAKITLVGGAAPQPAARTIAYWRFEEGPPGAAATGRVLDASGNNLHGTPQNGPVYSSNVPVRSIYRTDAVNSCSLSFNGYNQRIFIPDNPLFDLGRSLTLEAYVNVQGLPTNGSPEFIVIRGDDRAWMDPYWLAVLPDGHLCFQIDDGATSNGATAVKVESPNITPLNTWLHVAGTLDDRTGEMCLYVDGSLAASAVTSRRPLAALQPGANPGVAIGGPTTPHVPLEYFHGLIDEVRLSDEALTPSGFLNAAPRSSHVAVAELSSKPHVLRPAKERARANFCEISKTGFHKATVGDLIELEYTYSVPPAMPSPSARPYNRPFLPGTVPEAVDVKQTPNGAIVASPLGTRTVEDGRAGRRAIVFYFEAKRAGNDTVTLVVDGTPYAYHFQVDEPPPPAGQTPALRVYPDELKKGDKLSDGPGKPFDITETARLVWVDLQPDRPFPHDTRYVLVTAGGLRSEQGQWWPVVNGRPLWAPAGQDKVEAAPATPPPSSGPIYRGETVVRVAPDTRTNAPAPAESLKGRTVRGLIEALKDKDPRIRAAAAAALGRGESLPEVTQALWELKKREADPEVQRAIRDALDRLWGK